MGETTIVGHNCSILHHVTLGGSGKKGVDRHPQVGNGVLLGAGATLLGPVKIGDGSQVGAGTLVISDLPAHVVAVGGMFFPVLRGTTLQNTTQHICSRFLFANLSSCPNHWKLYRRE